MFLQTGGRVGRPQEKFGGETVEMEPTYVLISCRRIA